MGDLEAIPTTCPACQGPKPANTYLCKSDWFTLTADARTALLVKDGIPAARRLGELRNQIKAAVPLDKVVITP